MAEDPSTSAAVVDLQSMEQPIPDTTETPAPPARNKIHNVLKKDDKYQPNFQWMKEHIGDMVVRGITETLLLRPEDPIEYLGHWLAQQVRNVKLDKQVLQERAQIQAEIEECRQIAEDRARRAQMKLLKEQQRKDSLIRAEEEAKAKQEAELRAKELEQIRAERTENKAPLSFGIPETIPEIPSVNGVIGDND